MTNDCPYCGQATSQPVLYKQTIIVNDPSQKPDDWYSIRQLPDGTYEVKVLRHLP